MGLLLVLLPLSSQAPKAQEKTTLTIAWIPKALNNPVFALGRDGAFAKARELTRKGPINVDIVYTASLASDAGIPVMTWDSDSPDSQRFTYLGVSNYDGERVAAKLLAKALGGKGKVALLTGVPGTFNLEERIRGFKDEAKKSYPGIKISKVVPCDDDIMKGVMVLWGKASKAGKIKTIAFDTLPVGLQYMKKGMLQGFVGQKYWGWGYDTVQMLYNHIVNGKQFESWTDSGMDIVGSDNVGAMMKMRDTGLIFVFRDVSYISISAFGECLVIVTGGAPTPIGVLAGMAAGAFFGFANGLLISKAKMQPFIITLGNGMWRNKPI